MAAALTGISLPTGGALASSLAAVTSVVGTITLGALVASFSLLTVRALVAAGAACPDLGHGR